MVKKLILFLIICMIYSVNCIKLTEICRNQIFRYFNPFTGKYMVVNSFYKLNVLDKYPKIGEFLLKKLEEPHFFNPKQLQALHKTKSDFDNKLFEIFFNYEFIDKLNNGRLNSFAPVFDEFIEVRNNTLFKLKSLFIGNEHLIDKYDQKMEKFENLLLDVSDNFKNKRILNEEFLSDEKLETRLINFGSQLMPNQKPVFPFFENREEIYYSQQILEVSNFTIINTDGSKDITPNSRPNLDVYLVIPFNYENYPTYSDKCDKKTDLPPFYRSSRHG